MCFLSSTSALRVQTRVETPMTKSYETTSVKVDQLCLWDRRDVSTSLRPPEVGAETFRGTLIDLNLEVEVGREKGTERGEGKLL